jgi:hypothetical protein
MLCALPCAWQLGLLVATVAARFSYPYDLEWMEGGMLAHAARIASGEGIYVPPSLDFIPYLYTPLYPALLAAVGTVTGLTYQLGRAVSVLAMLGFAAVAVRTVCSAAAGAPAARPAARFAALAALGWYAATYPWLEGWYDIVRADSLFLAMVVSAWAGLVAVTDRRRAPVAGRRRHLEVAGLAALLALSFFCKQTGVLCVAAGGALLLWRDWRRLPVYVAVSGFVGLGGTWLLQRATGGWFWTYIYEVHQVHDFSRDRFRRSFAYILLHFPVMSALIALGTGAALLVRLRRGHWLPQTAALLGWLPLYAASVVAGALGWATQWAHFNAYLLAMATGAITAAAALPALVACIAASSPAGTHAGGMLAWLRTHAAQLAGLTAALAVAVQLATVRWRPHHFIPTAADRTAGDRLIERLRRTEGEVLIPYHPWYARLAGKRTYVHRMGVLDVTYGGRWPVAGLSEALRQGRFALVLLDRAPGPEFAALHDGYRLDELLPAGERPRLFTGAKVEPSQIWVPAGSDRPPAGTSVLYDFEDGGLPGWHITGTAWGNGPVRRRLPRQAPVGGYRGRYYLSSFHGGDPGTGRLESPAFPIAGPVLGFRRSGGQDPRRLRIELEVAGRTVYSASGTGDEYMRELRWDVSLWRGRSARLLLTDEATGPWGHLNVDAFYWLPSRP